MHGWLCLLALQALSVPARSPPGTAPAPVPERLSLVIATAVSETDPRPLCDDPTCTSLFLGRYGAAETLAGPVTPTEFTARVEMGSPWNQRYRLALIVEQRPGQEPLVRAMTGFNSRTGQACFEAAAVRDLNWSPEGTRISRDGGGLCVSETR